MLNNLNKISLRKGLGRQIEQCLMKTRKDTELNVSTLDEDESWRLFVKTAGDVANLEDIQPLEKENARECAGLPLAITIIGTSMRGKTRVEL
ncbi:hypothetical protein KY284_020346 [Solanum tuberosum]|nr:hypothetical protein KY284_020345 [Solanum tuberosum]KAH0679261.1 hypothetical protein KY284_020346 [Solanum tuberosum]